MQGNRRILAAEAMVLATLMIFTGTALAYDKLFIVASQASVGLAKEFFTTLSNESIPLAIITDQFDKVKNEKYIVVLGGAKGSGTVDDFIKQVLTKEEQEEGNRPGGKMFVKENVFSQGQTIIVFTGPDEAAAADVRKKSRKTWWSYFVNWFELDTSLPMAY